MSINELSASIFFHQFEVRIGQAYSTVCTAEIITAIQVVRLYIDVV